MKVLSTLWLALPIVISIDTSSFGQVDNFDVVFNLKSSNVGQFKWKIDTTFVKFVPTDTEVLRSKKISLVYFDSLFSTDMYPGSKTIRQNFNGYYRQYVGYTDDRGHRIIYINCFCKDFFRDDFDPTEWWVHVYDGGSCFYQIRIDMETGRSFGLYINGSS